MSHASSDCTERPSSWPGRCFWRAGLAQYDTTPSLYHLAIALYAAYEDSDDLALLDEAVQNGREATKNPHPAQIPSLLNLIRHLKAMSYARQDLTLLKEAETAARWAVHITSRPNASKRAECLFELARTLETMAHQTGDLTYLREAVEAADSAIRLTSDPVDRHLRSIIADGMVKQLRRQESPSPMAGKQVPPPPPPPLDPIS